MTVRGSVVLVAVLCVTAVQARTIRVHAGESIQAAVDRASPGTRILVSPGVYHEAGATRAVTVTKNDIRLVGASRVRPVVLEQTGGQRHGIWVSPADSTDPEEDELPPCGVSGGRIHGFRLQNVTVQGFAGFGTYLACVDGFEIDHDTFRRDGTYGVFPVRSSDGRLARNVASDTRSDACIYVGQSERVVMEHNRASGCVIGLQAENSHEVVVRHNEAFGNTTGIIVDVINARQVTAASDNRVTDNFVHDNNQPNPAPPDSDTGMLQAGIGIIIDSADRTFVARNRIEGEHLAGLTLVNFCVLQNPCVPPADIEPYPDGNRFVANRFKNNFSDVFWGPGAGTDNCFRPDPKGLRVTGGPLPVCQ